jgi:predicted carbohydrate-binding protein with CBM5 and CBM33 domain
MDKLRIDCSTGAEQLEPLSPEEEAQRVSDAAEAVLFQEQEDRRTAVLSKIDTAIAEIRNELANWPSDLANNSNSSTIVGRVNLMAAQLRRTTERTEKLGQLARGLYDVEE